MRKLITIGVVLAALAGGGYWYYRYKQKAPAPTVTTAKVTRGDLTETVGATGTLQAVTTVQVGTQVSGTILQLNADFNSLVRKGQVLARLDPSLFETQIEQARANLVRAEADMERLRVGLDDARTKLSRARELAEKKLIAQTDLEAAEVAVRSAEAQLRSQQAGVTQSQASLRQNQVNLQHTVIEAPIDGLVISRNVDVGQTVAASMSAPTLFLLAADLTKMQVLASLDESDVGRIRPKQTVRFRVDAFPTEEFRGTVTQVRLQPTTVQNVVTYQTVIDVPNPELKLKPGMTANVNIEIARRSNVLRVPNTALRFRPTAEMFAAFGQTPPPGGGGRGGGPGRDTGSGPDSRLAPPASQPMAKQTASVQPQPAADQRPLRGAARAPAQTITEKSEAASPTEPAAGEGGRGGAPGEGGRGGGARRGNFAERMATMSPEDRERFMERMRQRGLAQGDGPRVAADTAGRQGGPRQAEQARARTQPTPAASAQTSATTFDALFGPLPPTETFGQLWLHGAGQLQRVRVRLGISDGQQTELIQAIDGTVQEGTEVVTLIMLGGTRQTTTPAAGNAFPGLDGGRGRQGGFGGGGNRGGGRGQ